MIAGIKQALAVRTPKLARGMAGRLARRLRGDTSGLALIEFAFGAPLVLGMGMLGTETAVLVITHLQVSQIAMQVADNASRVGEQEVLVARKVYESDINDVLYGAQLQAGGLNLYANGRVIVSSLQVRPAAAGGAAASAWAAPGARPPRQPGRAAGPRSGLPLGCCRLGLWS